MKSFLPIVSCLLIFALVAPAPAARERRGDPDDRASRMAEFQATRLLKKATDLLEIKEYERAVKMLESVVDQYPTSDVRYQAYLELGRHFLNVNDQAQGIVYLRRLQDLEPEEGERLSEEMRDIYLEGLYLTGTAYFDMRQYGSAFPVLRRITDGYPNTVWANQAYYYIGMCHFASSNWGKAIKALNLVGTFVDPESPTVEYVEAGRRFYVKVSDGDLPVLTRLGKDVTLTVSTDGGDRETVNCVPLAGGEAMYIGSISTELGSAKPDDGTLQVIAGSVITTRYNDANTRDGQKNVARESTTRVVSSAGLTFTLGNYDGQTDAAFFGSSVFLRLHDADVDSSPGRDEVAVRVVSRYQVTDDEGDGMAAGGGENAGLSSFFRDEEDQYEIRDEVVLTLAELGEIANGRPLRSARFGGSFELARRADSAEVDKSDNRLTCELGDEIVATYTDELHINGDTPREVTASVRVISEVSGKPSATQYVVQDPVVRARKNLVEAEAYLELARIFKSMGLMKQAGEKAEEGLSRVDKIIGTSNPIPQEMTEESFRLKWSLYLARNDLQEAVATCQVFNRLFPDSPLVDQALMGIAEIREENDDYGQAIEIYRQILALENSQVKAKAQYRIAKVTEAQAAGSDREGAVARATEKAIVEYKKCAENYPESEYAGESLARLVDYYIDKRDYAQADELLDQVFMDYQDAEFLDRMLLKWVIVGFRMGNFEKAAEKCRQLIFEYPGSPYAERAKQVLPKIEQKLNS